MLPAVSQRLSFLRVARDHPFLSLQNVVEDRAADRHLAVAPRSLAVPPSFVFQLVGLRVEHDAAVVRLHPLEDQFDDPLQQGVDAQRLADRHSLVYITRRSRSGCAVAMPTSPPGANRCCC
jgi:hypothetical protein